MQFRHLFEFPQHWDGDRWKHEQAADSIDWDIPVRRLLIVDLTMIAHQLWPKSTKCCAFEGDGAMSCGLKN